METFRIHLKQKEKNKFSLAHLKEEINEMYNNTIADSSREDLGFFVLIAFLSLKKGKHSFLYHLLEINLPKLRSLIEEIAGLERYLKKNEYAELKEKKGLTDVLRQDVFFLLLRTVSNADAIIIRFSDFFEKHPHLKSELQKISKEFGAEVESFHVTFAQNKIRDFRTDPENGNQLDLSKSIYRTIGMRMSRRLDISLQNYTDVLELKRNSPIDLTFLQHIDPQLLMDLWQIFHLDEYLATILGGPSSALEFARNHISLDINLGEGVNMLFYAWLYNRLTGIAQNSKEKRLARKELEEAKQNIIDQPDVDDLMSVLVKSILRSPENLKNEIEKLKEKLEVYRDEKKLTNKERKIKQALVAEIRKLSNIVVAIEREKVNKADQDHDID